MAKLTLTDLANLQNEGTAVSAINANNALIETAMENTLSRDGTTPNTMSANLDLNSHRILNLLDAATAQEPLTLSQFQGFQDAILGDIQETLDFVFGSTPNLFMVRGETEWGSRSIVGDDLPAPAVSTKGGVFARETSGGSILSGIDTTGTPTIATSMTLLGSSSAIIAVGRQGATQPAFQVNASAASSITGISITSQATGNGVNVTAIGETNVPIILNGAGTGGIFLNPGATGPIAAYQNFSINHDTNPTFTFGTTGNTGGFIHSNGTGSITFRNAAQTATYFKATPSTTTDDRNIEIIGGRSGSSTHPTITVSGTGSASSIITTLFPVTVTSTNTSAFTAGRQGTTNPAFQVDSATALSATGIKITAAAAAGGVDLATISSGTNENLTVNAKGTGTITLGNTSTGNVLSSRPLVVTASVASSFAVGPNGSTNPVLSITSGASNVNGYTIQGANTGALPLILASGSDANIALGLSSKGNASVQFYTQNTSNLAFQILDTASGNRWITVASSNGGNPTLATSAGSLAITPAIAAGAAISAVGAITANNATAIPAGGTAGAGFNLSSTSNFGVYFGSGAPTLSAAQGSLYLRSDGSSTSTRLYVNTNGTTGWTNVTTAA